MPRRPRLLRRFLAGAVTSVALAVCTIALAPSASAHDQLVSTSPTDGATVAPPDAVALTFSESLVETGDDVVVTGPAGQVAGTVSVDGPVLAEHFADPLSSGDYSVVWRAVSADGHPVSGKLGFTVQGSTSTPAATATGAGASTAVASNAASPKVIAQDGSSRVVAQHGWDWLTALVIALVVAALAAAALVVVARRRAGERG